MFTLRSETEFALCHHCKKCNTCNEPEALVCDEFTPTAPREIENVASLLTGEFFNAHGMEALHIQQQMVRLSHTVPR